MAICFVKHKGWFCLLAVTLLVWQAQAELFTALADIEPLLQTHKKITHNLENYLHKEEQRLATLKRHLEVFKREDFKAMEDIPNYLGNPIHAFTLMKRLTIDLDQIEKNINIGTEYIKNITMTQPGIQYPDSEDVTGAAQAMSRLQQTYKLTAKDLSDGIINGVQYSYPMSSSDCSELGRHLYEVKEYHNALPWFFEALRKYESTDHTRLSDVDLLDYIAFSYYRMKELDDALKWTEKLLERDPTHTHASGNVLYYKKAIKDKEEKRKWRNRDEEGEDLDEQPYVKSAYWNAEEEKKYEALCRGEMMIPHEVSKQLKCSYITGNHPFLKIAPIKMEQMYIKPDIFVFHEVISDSEVTHIQNMAKPRFQRAEVANEITGEPEFVHYRISKSAWITDVESKVVATVSQRTSDMTGLSMFNVEALQVVNYGIGGHYEPHFDFAKKNNESYHHSDFIGNRIATILFYMSDVAQGGATVFIELGLTLFPIRGAAVFWMNLHPSGEGDFATRHAACPVVRGSKWVSNKWVHQGGQEFLKPCDLNYQEEGFARKLPKPIRLSSR